MQRGGDFACAVSVDNKALLIDLMEMCAWTDGTRTDFYPLLRAYGDTPLRAFLQPRGSPDRKYDEGAMFPYLCGDTLRPRWFARASLPISHHLFHCHMPIDV